MSRLTAPILLIGLGFDMGHRAVAVVGYPDGFLANHDGAAVGTDGDGVSLGFPAGDIEAADAVLTRIGDPDDAGSGVYAAGVATDFERFAKALVDRRIYPGNRRGATVRDPDETVPDRYPGGATADRDRLTGNSRAEVYATDRPGRGAADPEAARADGEAQRRRQGFDATPEDL